MIRHRAATSRSKSKASYGDKWTSLEIDAAEQERVKRAMFAPAMRLVLPTDASKFLLAAFCRIFCDLAFIHHHNRAVDADPERLRDLDVGVTEGSRTLPRPKQPSTHTAQLAFVPHLHPLRALHRQIRRVQSRCKRR